MMFSKCSLRFVGFLFGVVACTLPARAAEESIDSLLKKLPPPDKLVKAHVQQALEDPAFKDPLARQALGAAESGNYSGALNFARQLTKKDPNSAFAYLLHGALANDARQFSE